MNSKYFRSNIDQNCFIKYSINIDNFNDYWCYDFSNIFKNHQFVVIEEFTADLCNPDKIIIIKDLLKLFCDIMTIENRIIVFPLNELLYDIYRYKDYWDDILETLLDLLDEIGFVIFESLDYDFDDSSVYFYTRSKLGNSILNNLELYYNTEISKE